MITATHLPRLTRVVSLSIATATVPPRKGSISAPLSFIAGVVLALTIAALVAS